MKTFLRKAKCAIVAAIQTIQTWEEDSRESARLMLQVLHLYIHAADLGTVRVAEGGEGKSCLL